MEKIEYKDIQCREIKVEKDETHLYIEGYGAYFGNEDSYKDIIEPGAFADFLKSEDRQRVRLCYMHDLDKVIGVIDEMKEDEKGLYFKAKISNTTLGKDTATLIEDGALNEFSIGYRVVEAEFPEENSPLRLLKSIYLYEISVVSRAANPEAVVTSTERKDEGIKETETNSNKSTHMEEEMKKELEAAQVQLKAETEAREKLEKELAEAKNAHEESIKNIDASLEEMNRKLDENSRPRTLEGAFENFVKSEEFKKNVESVMDGKVASAKMEIKVDTSAITGTVLRTMGNTQVEADAQKHLALLGRVAVAEVPQDKSFVLWPEGSFTDNTGYVDEATAVGTASAGAIEEKSRMVSKIGAKLPFSREIASDASYFLNWLKTEAIEAIRNKVDTEMVSGAGADTDSTTKKKVYGIVGQGSTAFNATTAGCAAAISKANLVNLIDAIDAQIELGTNGAFFADTIFMHPSDFAIYKNMKNDSGSLLFTQNGGIYEFMGKQVVRTSKLSAGQMLVADMRCPKLYEKLGFEVEIERVASTDSYVMYLRWRGQVVVPSNKKKGIIYVSNIATAIAAITASEGSNA